MFGGYEIAPCAHHYVISKPNTAHPIDNAERIDATPFAHMNPSPIGVKQCVWANIGEILAYYGVFSAFGMTSEGP
jgi:hypothetical protein